MAGNQAVGPIDAGPNFLRHIVECVQQFGVHEKDSVPCRIAVCAQGVVQHLGESLQCVRAWLVRSNVFRYGDSYLSEQVPHQVDGGRVLRDIPQHVERVDDEVEHCIELDELSVHG